MLWWHTHETIGDAYDDVAHRLNFKDFNKIIISLFYMLSTLTLSLDKSRSVKNCFDLLSPSMKLYCCEFLCSDRSTAIRPCCGDCATCNTTPDGRTPYLWWSRTTSMFCVVITDTPPSWTVSGNNATSSSSLLDFENTCNHKCCYHSKFVLKLVFKVYCIPSNVPNSIKEKPVAMLKQSSLIYYRIDLITL